MYCPVTGQHCPVHTVGKGKGRPGQDLGRRIDQGAPRASLDCAVIFNQFGTEIAFQFWRIVIFEE